MVANHFKSITNKATSLKRIQKHFLKELEAQEDHHNPLLANKNYTIWQENNSMTDLKVIMIKQRL